MYNVGKVAQVPAKGGDSPLADIPGNHFMVRTDALASRASNAADAIVPLFVARAAGKLLSADHIPHTDQVGSATNHAAVKIINRGSAGSGTALLAARTYSATAQNVGSHQAGALTVEADPSYAAGDVIALSYASVGNGIALVAHNLSLYYQLT